MDTSTKPWLSICVGSVLRMDLVIFGRFIVAVRVGWLAVGEVVDCGCPSCAMVEVLNLGPREELGGSVAASSADCFKARRRLICRIMLSVF